MPLFTDLCAGAYSAYRLPGYVLLFAVGIHRSAGCPVLIRQEPGDSSVLRFSLWHVTPETDTLHALTPYAVCEAVQTTRRLEYVELRDAAGIRRVPVEDLPTGLMLHQP